MRDSVNQFTKICAKNLDCPEPIYEFGSFQVPGQEQISNLRLYFAGKKYVGADMRQGPGVDIVLNLHHIDLPDESVGTVILMDTLEHVEYPRKAIEEIYRILKPNGVLMMSSALNFPIHDYPGDYWRFTPQAFISLLKPFALSFSDAAGIDILPEVVVGIAVKGPSPQKVTDAFYREFDAWKRYWTDQLRPKKPRGFIRFLRFLERAWKKWTPQT